MRGTGPGRRGFRERRVAPVILTRMTGTPVSPPFRRQYASRFLSHSPMLKALRRQLARLGPLLFRLLAATWRVSLRGPVPPAPSVLAFWHGEMLPVWRQFAHLGSRAVVSQSRDGGLLTQLLQSWGYQVIRGSSSRGGKEALAEMVAAARLGRLLVTPDGPRGPAHVLKPGAVVAAAQAGVPLYVCRVQCTAAIHGTHWDRFLVPLPFASIVLEFIEVPVPPDADRAAIDSLIAATQDTLNQAA